MSDDFDIDALIGAPTAPARSSHEARQARAAEITRDLAKKNEIRRAGMGQTKMDEEEFLLPMTTHKLGTILHMDPATVKKRLKNCPIAGSVGAGRPIYYFHQAIAYLVKPKWKIGDYIKTLNKADLPNDISLAFWQAERVKNKVLIETGQAWTTPNVLEVLGEAAMLIKDRIPLITEEMRDANLTDDQLALLTRLTDRFQHDVHQALIEMPKRRQTYSRINEIDTGEEPVEAED